MLAFRNAPDIVGAWLDMTSHMPDEERALVASRGDALTEDTLEATRQGGVGYWLDGQTQEGRGRSRSTTSKRPSTFSTVTVTAGTRCPL